MEKPPSIQSNRKREPASSFPLAVTGPTHNDEYSNGNSISAVLPRPFQIHVDKTKLFTVEDSTVNGRLEHIRKLTVMHHGGQWEGLKPVAQTWLGTTVDAKGSNTLLCYLAKQYKCNLFDTAQGKMRNLLPTKVTPSDHLTGQPAEANYQPLAISSSDTEKASARDKKCCWPSKTEICNWCLYAVFVFITVNILLIIWVLAFDVRGILLANKNLNLEDHCGEMVILPCPDSRGGAGAIQFSRVPTTACRVKVTTSAGCESYAAMAIPLRFTSTLDTYSFMPLNSKMEIYDTSQSRTLKKQWTGEYTSAGQYSNPTSAGQFLSRYASVPEISIEYTPDVLYAASNDHKVQFNYVIVKGQYSYYSTVSTYCSALSGYVNDDFICDTTDDRVNCPTTYNDYTYSMDAARSRQYCDSGLQGGEIAGIVIGCAAFVAIVDGIVTCVACAKRRPGVTEAQTAAFTNNKYTAAPSVKKTIAGAPPSHHTQMYAPYPPPGNVAMCVPPPVDNASLSQPAKVDPGKRF